MPGQIRTVDVISNIQSKRSLLEQNEEKKNQIKYIKYSIFKWKEKLTKTKKKSIEKVKTMCWI